ncbi:MAG: hypothetical protein R3190_04740, partial [Thermoanaerobaculia bacterium]|nr:hypothetical protein [Thermoanaerobaculia bacterium]
MAHTPAARLSLLAAAALISAAGPAAAESPTAPAAHCRVEIELDPARGTIEGRARYSLTAVEDHLHDGRLELLLHDALRLDAVAAFGHELEPTRQPGADGVDRYLVAIDEPSGVVAVDLAWSGVLRQDVAAGEVPGEIHNRAMRAHIGDDGIYLAPEAAWHP